eukprot:m.15830 g.15830  ORF g.15830 m.15830 type:complete len:361 (+) comp3072_c0_seq1:725-1807(+)
MELHHEAAAKLVVLHVLHSTDRHLPIASLLDLRADFRDVLAAQQRLDPESHAALAEVVLATAVDQGRVIESRPRRVGDLRRLDTRARQEACSGQFARGAHGMGCRHVRELGQRRSRRIESGEGLPGAKRALRRLCERNLVLEHGHPADGGVEHGHRRGHVLVVGVVGISAALAHRRGLNHETQLAHVGRSHAAVVCGSWSHARLVQLLASRFVPQARFGTLWESIDRHKGQRRGRGRRLEVVFMDHGLVIEEISDHRGVHRHPGQWERIRRRQSPESMMGIGEHPRAIYEGLLREWWEVAEVEKMILRMRRGLRERTTTFGRLVKGSDIPLVNVLGGHEESLNSVNAEDGHERLPPHQVF